MPTAVLRNAFDIPEDFNIESFILQLGRYICTLQILRFVTRSDPGLGVQNPNIRRVAQASMLSQITGTAIRNALSRSRWNMLGKYDSPPYPLPAPTRVPAQQTL